MVSHYAIESVAMTRGRKLWLVRECDRNDNGEVVFTSRDEEAAHQRAEALALLLVCRRDLRLVESGVRP